MSDGGYWDPIETGLDTPAYEWVDQHDARWWRRKMERAEWWEHSGDETEDGLVTPLNMLGPEDLDVLAEWIASIICTPEDPGGDEG